MTINTQGFYAAQLLNWTVEFKVYFPDMPKLDWIDYTVIIQFVDCSFNLGTQL